MDLKNKRSQTSKSRDITHHEIDENGEEYAVTAVSENRVGLLKSTNQSIMPLHS